MNAVTAVGRRLGRFLGAAFAALLLSGCTGQQVDLYDYIAGKPQTPTATPAPTTTASGSSALAPSNAIAPDMAASDDSKPIAELYNKGLENLNDGSYRTAAKNFAEVERQHPYSSWATRAVLMQAYAQDAQQKALLARDHLAAKELEVGRYYLRKKAYLAAINRFKSVVINYQTTSQTPEALYRLTESYLALGVRSEAQTAAAVLGQNFPNSDWYKDAFSLLQSQGLEPSENSQSWISQAWNQIKPF